MTANNACCQLGPAKTTRPQHDGEEHQTVAIRSRMEPEHAAAMIAMASEATFGEAVSDSGATVYETASRVPARDWSETLRAPPRPFGNGCSGTWSVEVRARTGRPERRGVP